MNIQIIYAILTIGLTSWIGAEAKLFTSITSKSFEEGANPIQFNYGVAGGFQLLVLIITELKSHMTC